LAEEHAQAATTDREEVAALEERSATILKERAALEEEAGELRTRLDSARLLLGQARVAMDSLSREIEGLQGRLAELRLDEQKTAMARDEIVRRAQEELQLDELALSEGFTPDADLATNAALDELDVHVRELKSRLDKLGPVNMEAMAELEEAGGRLTFMETQRADLQQARSTLEETIATIDGESKKLFLETFEAVRTNFQRIFRQLFGGGKADVTLEEGADPLDAGVDIYARPPGRELLPISLLSGGQRTMTALALLFAVFEARPSPFCILDEVDAALDEANVGRFLAMLDGFRSHTQFVVVTHKKLTMAACEGLYGVTMEVKGVSRQVSVELGDVERWAGRDHSSARVVDQESGEPVVVLQPVERVVVGEELSLQ
jgi:chromosome segregation protein